MSIETRFCALLLLALLPYAAPARAQQNSVTDESPTRVYLDVVVTSRSGPPVSGLQQQDFTVLDNKTSRAITSFHALGGSQAPVEVILLIDAVNTSYESVVYERQQIDKFLRANNGHLAYPTSLVIFKDTGSQIQDAATTDGNALSADLDHAEIGLRSIRRSSGIYGADERFQLSLKTLHQLAALEGPRPGRKIILWVSPGWPLLSGARIELSAKQQRQIFADVVSLSAVLRQARVTLYSVDPLGPGESVLRDFYYEEFLKGISKPSDVAFGDLGLQVLATQTGGLALTASNDITAQLQRCIADAEAYYELSFDPPPAEHPDEYHHLEIKMAKPGLTARTRQGYYAQP
jgi:VWFA-related protein